MDLEKLLQEAFKQGENGLISLEQFKKFVDEKKLKLADLSEGKYVSKDKFDDELSKKDKQIETLNKTITDRDTDLATIKKDLENAGEDKSKLDGLSKQLSDLQSKYDTDTQNFKSQLSKQAYEFAVKDYAGTQKFTSNAAKRDFISAMTAKGLQMEGDKILGADDFANMYFTENSDARLVEPTTDDKSDEPTPHFVQPTAGDVTPDNNASPFQFNFTGVRPHE